MNHLNLSQLNIFSSYTIDRSDHNIGDPRTLNELSESGHARFLPITGYKVMVTENLEVVTIDVTEFRSQEYYKKPPVYLGRDNGLHYFAVSVDIGHGKTQEFRDLRSLAPLLDKNDAALLGYAVMMITWQRNHRFCGVCGAPTISISSGHILKCSGDNCGIEHYPRIDPAVIVLVENAERVLLGRKSDWPEKRYSAIAGFIEPGESAEQALVREVAEETGVEVAEVSYQSSQPWPFPGSLMLGYFAKASTDQIQLRDGELQEARWFTREELSRNLENGTFLPPTAASISFSLMETWFNQSSNIPFRMLCENNTTVR
ncbi:MAG: NAD(+) diphosphatase [Acidiferrobacteraceae bacterium]|nr:NAD(+) diphosphatase [Acidiferrobacteraceae bacterium]|tara:strand:- start:6242 stop:7189 length:948 start_codon:yes stop_codon:yes gene_type:complete